MDVKRIDNSEIKLSNAALVTVKHCGNVVELRYSVGGAEGQVIEKIDNDNYVVLSTGEIREYNHTEFRAESPENLRKSFAKLRDLINANTSEPEKCLFVTLTYKENMQDTKRLYTDFKKFVMRLKTYLNGEAFEYISVVEPQSRGAWHIHALLIFDKKRPFIPNEKFAKIWGHGFTKVSKLDSRNNDIGMYLTAYLTDISVDEATINDIKAAKEIKKVTVTENGTATPKRIIKGGRLKYYPKGMRIFRASRRINRPIIFRKPNGEAEQFVSKMGLELAYEKTVKVGDGIAFERIINYRQFKKPRTI